MRWKRLIIDIRKRIIMNFIKKQIDKKAKEQWLMTWNDNIKKENQYQKHTTRVNLNYRSLKKFQKINKLTFSTFIQLKMKHDYFKSYLHRLSENNLNKCYEICKTRQTLKHLLLNCKHYKAEQLQLKAKAQFKNMNIILMLFIIKIERKNSQKRNYNWQRFIEAYDIWNRLTSYRAQSYNQNKFSFDSIVLQMTVLQVENRKSKFSALTQIKINDETRVH